MTDGAGDGTSPGDSCTVVHIEDNTANLRLVSQLLARNPRIELLEARDPEAGLELARVHRPALVLVDLNLPGMDGYDVLRCLRATSGLEEVPVVAITANAMERERERGLEAGFTDYVTKPLDIERFETLVVQWLWPGAGATPG